jgi:Autotransporter beta-domain
VVGGDAQANTTFAATTDQANIFGPGFGAYTTYINGGFSVDGLVKNDWFRLTETSPSSSVNLNNFNVAGNVQYKFDVLKASFIEPTGGVVYTNTAYGSGAAALGLVNGYVTRLQTGARFGTAWDWNNIHFEPYLLALIYDNVTVTGTALQNIGVQGITVPTDQGLVRGEFDLQLLADFGHGWSAFTQGDVRFGEGLLAGAIKIGARKQW